MRKRYEKQKFSGARKKSRNVRSTYVWFDWITLVSCLFAITLASLIRVCFINRSCFMPVLLLISKMQFNEQCSLFVTNFRQYYSKALASKLYFSLPSNTYSFKSCFRCSRDPSILYPISSISQNYMTKLELSDDCH